MRITLFMAMSLNGMIARPDYREDLRLELGSVTQIAEGIVHLTYAVRKPRS